ncbi:ATP-binding protein [Clavibacter sp. DM3]|nr:ATP-binding protein [Clavibacter zhangzhiyongii]
MYNDDGRHPSESLSPYTPGSVPTSLPGRADKLQQFREAAQRMASDGLFIPRVHVDHGPRGIGKTSLLREAQRIFGGYRIRTVLITANPDEDLVRSLLGELRQVVGTGNRLRKSALEAIDSATVTLGAPGIVQVGVSLTPERARTAASAKQVQKAIRAAMDAVIHDGDAGIALLIDEIQEADPESLRTARLRMAGDGPASRRRTRAAADRALRRRTAGRPDEDQQGGDVQRAVQLPAPARPVRRRRAGGAPGHGGERRRRLGPGRPRPGCGGIRRLPLQGAADRRCVMAGGLPPTRA